MKNATICNIVYDSNIIKDRFGKALAPPKRALVQASHVEYLLW